MTDTYYAYTAATQRRSYEELWDMMSELLALSLQFLFCNTDIFAL